MSSVPLQITMFEQLPVEIIQCIITHLPFHDLLEFRQTSTKLYHKSNDFCARRLFHTLTTDLSFDDLHWLSTSLISNVQVSCAVQTIIVQQKINGRPLGYDYYWNRTERGGPLTLPCDGFEAFRTLFSHLPNCKTVRVRAGDRQSDIDGPDDQLEPADVLHLVLLLAAEDGIQLEAIEVIKAFGNEGAKLLGTHLNPDRLPVDTLSDPHVHSMLSNLKGMTLSLVYADGLLATGWLPTVFGALHRLKSLDVNLDMSWGDVDATEALMGRLQLPELEDLQLCRLRIGLTMLQTVLSPCRHALRKIRLESITLISSTDKDESWKDWLADIMMSHSNLRYLGMDLLSTITRHHNKTHLDFSSLSQFLVPGDNDPIVENANHHHYQCLLPDTHDLSLKALALQVSSHGWVREGQLVLSGVSYAGNDMQRAIALLEQHATEVSMF